MGKMINTLEILIKRRMSKMGKFRPDVTIPTKKMHFFAIICQKVLAK